MRAGLLRNSVSDVARKAVAFSDTDLDIKSESLSSGEETACRPVIGIVQALSNQSNRVVLLLVLH